MSDALGFTLTLWRHGEIASDGRLIGATDLPLTELGWQQTHAAWSTLSAAEPITALACSPRLRCLEPALQFAEAADLALTVEDGFSEMHFGQWEGQLLTVLALPPDWSQQIAAGTLIIPEGESVAAFSQRVISAFLAWLDNSSGAHRVMLTHGGVIAVILATCLGISLEAAQRIVVARGGFVQLAMLPPHLAYLTRLVPPCEA